MAVALDATHVSALAESLHALVCVCLYVSASVLHSFCAYLFLFCFFFALICKKFR